MDAPAKNSSEDRVSVRRKLLYGVGGYTENGMQNAVTNMTYPFFNVGLGVAPSLLGIAVMIFRIWDAITDPLMGWISDKTNTRLGRRRPYIFAGAICGGLLFALMWWVPQGMSSNFYFGWYLIFALLFFSAFTVYSVPFIAMGYELSTDYHERTRVMSYRMFFQAVAGVCIQWLLWFTQRDIFDGTVDGMKWVGIAMGTLMILFGIMPALFVKERKLTLSEITSNKEKLPLKSIFSVLKVRPFRYVLGAMVFAITGMFLVIIFGYYINVYYLFGGDQKAASTVLGGSGTAYHLTGMASLPLIAWISTKIGKKRAIIVFTVVGILGSAVKPLVFVPGNPWLQIVSVILLAPGLSAVFTLLSSITADVTDWDELQNGTRREGAFGAFYGWTMKLGFALCFYIASKILEWTGFDRDLGGNQSQETLDLMLQLYTIVPIIGLVGTLLIMWRFPITEDKVRKVREQLEARKRASADPSA